MIYKCPNCEAALIFEPHENRLICHSCDSAFRPEEITNNRLLATYMDLNVYSCGACGGEILVSDTDAATYCIYCGQPVVVFDRVSSELQPDYIIPFRITKEAAKTLLQYRLHKHSYAQRKFKNIEIDAMRGIYIPYWLYDIDYHDKQYYRVIKKVAGGLSESNRGYVKETEMMFKNLPINASYILDDEELQLLGSYSLEEMVPFNAGYLSGFYADRYDINFDEAAWQALVKAEKIFDDEIQDTLTKKGYEVSILKGKNPQKSIKKVSYVMLPVWFLTGRYQGQPYTLLVNGQTGTVAGNLPLNKVKTTMLFLRNLLLAGPIFFGMAFIFYLAYKHNQLNFGIVLLGVIMYLIIMIFSFAIGRNGVYSIKKRLAYTRSARIQKYVRQKKEV